MVSILKLFCCLFLSSLWEVLQMGLPEEKGNFKSRGRLQTRWRTFAEPGSRGSWLLFWCGDLRHL